MIDYFERAFRSSPGMMSIHDTAEGVFLDANDHFIEAIGYAYHEVIGKTPSDLNLWITREEKAYIWNHVRHKSPLRDYEFAFRIKNGEVRTGLLSFQYIMFDKKECLLSMLTDITEKKKYTGELLRLDRLNLIGQMAASIGHEVRNPLTTVRGYLQFLKTKSNYTLREDQLAIMIEELDRANSIITEFLALAKNRVTNQEPKCLKELINVMMPLIQANIMEAGRSLTIDINSSCHISADTKEIRQLLLNLLRNAIEATRIGGNITVRGFETEDSVILSVENNGEQIPSHVLEKLGTPFLTTKDDGTGLGLPICYSIAERHKAQIKVTSEINRTCFEVWFPKVIA